MSGLSHNVFKQILTSEFGATEQDGALVVDEERKVSVLVEHEGGLLQVTKVTSVGFGDGYVAVSGEEGTYYVSDSVLFALRSQNADGASDKKTGFRP